MKIKIINTKTKVSVSRCIISQRKERKQKKQKRPTKKKTGYIIHTMNCYPRNG